jgi:hypothetical protein
LLPVLIWLVGWFEWWFGVPAAALVVLGLWQMLVPNRASINWQRINEVLQSTIRPTSAALMLIAFAWVMTTAAGGVFDAGNSDWYKHRSILLDLGAGSWPTEPLESFRNHITKPILLRHYLGYFMVPGLLGKWFGPGALNWAVPVWTWCGVTLLFFMFTRGYRGWKTIAAVAVIVFFSGMDFLRVALLEGLGWLDFKLILEGWPHLSIGSEHIEREQGSPPKIQYSSHMTGLMWVPKHFLPAAIYVLLLIQLRRHPSFLSAWGLVLAAAPFWSPFVAIGLLPIVAVVALESGIRRIWSWQNMLVAPILAFLLFIFLSSGTGEIKQGWIWQVYGDHMQEVTVFLLILYLTEFIALAALLLIIRPALRSDAVFLVSLAVLLLLPLISFGENNDLAVRGAMPAIFLLCYYCFRALTDSSSDTGQGDASRLFFPRVLLVTLLGIGAITPFVELTRANNDNDFGFFRYDLQGFHYSIHGVFESLPTSIFVPLYVTVETPDWYLRLMGFDKGTEYLGEGDLIVDSTYEVFLDGKSLVFVGKGCSHLEERTRFFVHIWPLDERDLPADRSHFSADFFASPVHALRIGNTCFGIKELSESLNVGAIRTGQSNSDGRGHTWIAHYYSNAYRSRLLGEAGRPIMRSNFDVYLHQSKNEDRESRPSQDRLLYFKPECSENDTEGSFFLHIFPASMNDLEENRREAGFNASVFYFGEFSGRLGGLCFGARYLPSYSILRVETGQLGGQNEILWKSSYDFAR